MNLQNMNLEELSFNDVQNINAGESGWYWLMYGVAYTNAAIGLSIQYGSSMLY